MRHNFPVDVGTPSPDFQEWATTEVRYHGFADLPAAKAKMKGGPDYTTSPGFTCLGRQWDLTVYPGGHPDSGDGMISIYLLNRSDKGIKIKYCLCVRGPTGNDVICLSSPQSFFGPRGFPGHGSANFAHRSNFMDSLVDGSLIVDVRMKLVDTTETAMFIPDNPFSTTMLEMFMDEQSADVVFEVYNEQKGLDNDRKRAKTAPSTFYAHRLILKKCASTLAELCGAGRDHLTPIPITDVKPHIFHHMLYYVYGGKLAYDDMKFHVKEIIDAADRYGIVHLKLEAEACLVNSTPISADNVMEHLLYADSKNCALLKEAVMDFIVENDVHVLEKVSLRDLPGGPTLFADVLSAMARGKMKSGSEDRSNEKDQFSTMRISDLRQRVHGIGLGIDGSRETLIASLQENC